MGFENQTNPNEANAVIEAQPSATPKTAPAKTSLKKCIPSTTRDNAMLTARKNNGASDYPRRMLQHPI
jgi:hypothetical protein